MTPSPIFYTLYVFVLALTRSIYMARYLKCRPSIILSDEKCHK